MFLNILILSSNTKGCHIGTLIFETSMYVPLKYILSAS